MQQNTITNWNVNTNKPAEVLELIRAEEVEEAVRDIEIENNIFFDKTIRLHAQGVISETHNITNKWRNFY